MRASPIAVEHLVALALQHVNAGRRDEARRLCEQAVASHPPHPAVHQLLGWLALQAGCGEAACRHADASLGLRPGHGPTLVIATDAWFQCALSRHDARDLPGATIALQRVLTLDPGRADAEVNLGIVLQEAGRIDDAMRAYGRAYRLHGETFGRIAHALANAPVGRLWLELDALRDALGRA